MVSARLGRDSATVMISQRIVEGREADYQRWQEKTSEAASGFDGFEGTEVYPPEPGGEHMWVVVFRFATVAQLNAWLGSKARQELLDEGHALFEVPPAQQVLTGKTPTQEAVTAVVAHRVLPGREREFERWQDKALKAEEKFPGFMGSELFKPVPGLQDDWVSVFRFDTRDHLEGWLESDTRKHLLEEGSEYFSSYDVRKVKSSFGSWFQFDGAQAEPPPNWKQAMIVLLMLYPTVMLLGLTEDSWLRAEGIPGYLAMFIGNVCSVVIMTWLLAPLVNKLFSSWLMPSRANTVLRHVTGAAVIVVCYVLFIAAFGLFTR